MKKELRAIITAILLVAFYWLDSRCIGRGCIALCRDAGVSIQKRDSFAHVNWKSRGSDSCSKEELA